MVPELAELQEVERFRIFYDANDEELAQHKMDAFFLGQAIQQIAVMVKQASLVLNEGQDLVDLKVTVPAVEGSFAVEFALYAMENLPLVLPALGLTGGGALAVAQRLRNHKVLSIHTEDGSDRAEIVYENNGLTERIVCDKTDALLATDSVIRRAYNEVITQPLANKDAPIFRVEVEGYEVLRIAGEATTQFAPMPRLSFTHENIEMVEAVVALTQVNFTSARGWKMRYLDVGERAVTMEDTAFMERVLTNQQSFEKGDLFSVRMRITSTEKANGSVTTRYAIEEVYRHLADEERRVV
ncbi:hypothetical protein [Kluyvera cryocrescens]|uniref:hypothetical protein n=1 Tax=Kluyvera cryocrescens TaxID=580 RepID=UPI002DB57528|nr:hypothetical protein [Kluyvera cryocrescens]MEB6631807.1 hypothetical protein [Kluyvera cryocrescens]